MAETDIPTTYKQIVRFGLDKDGFFGLICSSDNGKTVKLIVGPDGLILHPEDGDKIWNLIESKVQSAINASGSQLTWSKISDKPDLVLEKDLPDFNQFAKKNELPDTSGLAKAATVDAVKTTAENALNSAEKAQSTAEANSKALSGKANKSEIPDISGLAKKSDIPVLPDLNSYALKSELPSLSGYARLSDIPSVAGLVKEAELADYAKKSDIPAPVDLSGYAKTDTVNAVKTTAESALSTAEKAQSTADANSKDLADKANKSEIPDISGLAKKSELPVVPTDLVHTAELEKVKSDVTQAKQDSTQALAVAKSASTTLDASKEFVAKNPSEYSEGFSRELKAAGILEVNQTTLGKNLTYSTIGLLTSVAIDSYGSRCVRQRFEVIDSDYPYTFERTGTGNVWYQWHGVTVWD